MWTEETTDGAFRGRLVGRLIETDCKPSICGRRFNGIARLYGLVNLVNDSLFGDVQILSFFNS